LTRPLFTGRHFAAADSGIPRPAVPRKDEFRQATLPTPQQDLLRARQQWRYTRPHLDTRREASPSAPDGPAKVSISFRSYRPVANVPSVRSGKSSISSVVFHKLPPTDTLFLESTTRILKDPIHSFMDFQVWETPGQIAYLDPQFDVEAIFSEAGALVWVIDAQDDYLDSLNRLHETLIAICPSYPQMNIEVFIH